MTAENLCVRCEKPMPDVAYACTSCADRARGQLATIAELAPAARDVVHRLVRRGGGPASGKPGSRPPLDLAAAERLDAVQNTLTTWARLVAEERNGRPMANAGADPIVHAARYLGEQLEWWRHRADVDEFLTDVDECVRRVYGMANGPQPGRYAGPCSALVDDPSAPCPVNCACHNGPFYACDEPGGCGSAGCGKRECGQDVTAKPGGEVGTCKACGAEYGVEEQQAWMISEVRGYLARPIEIAGMLLTLGVKVTYRRIMKFIEKDQLVARGHDEQQRALFRVGDVLEIVERNEDAQRPATQRGQVVA